MGEDASLDQFVGGSGDEDDTSANDESDGETAAAAKERPNEAADAKPAAEDGPTPATTTYAWTGEGAQCAACGEVVERRWEQDGVLVCTDCKEWDRT